MSAVLQTGARAWPTSDAYAWRARRGAIVGFVLTLAFAGAYAAVIVATGGDVLALAPVVGALVVLMVGAHPVTGVYLLFGAALLFEQFAIAGLAPLTAQSHLFQNVSAYTPLPIRLSLAELLMLLTGASLVFHRLTGRREALRMGPFGWAIIGYGAAFALGGLIGVARGGVDLEAGLNEVRAPIELCALYFLAANLVEDRRQLMVIVWMFVALVAVKALQGIGNYQEGPAWTPYDAGSVTSHEDIVFFDAAIALAIAMVALRVRTRFGYFLLGLQPVILVALLLDQRRTAFIAMAAVFAVITLLTFFVRRRRALVLAGVAAVGLAAYGALFWDSSGPIAEPVRAVRAVVEPSSSSTRDQSSNAWRVIENRNIAYTVRQLPLTGVGLGQEYLFQQQPPPLYGLPYWRNITHNALLWLWLKAGPFAALALWFLVARAVLVCSALFVREQRDGELRWLAALPLAIVICQVIFSSVDQGMTFSRSMIVLGTALGICAFLVRSASLESPAVEQVR